MIYLTMLEHGVDVSATVKVLNIVECELHDRWQVGDIKQK